MTNTHFMPKLVGYRYKRNPDELRSGNTHEALLQCYDGALQHDIGCNLHTLQQMSYTSQVERVKEFAAIYHETVVGLVYR